MWSLYVNKSLLYCIFYLAVAVKSNPNNYEEMALNT